MTDIVWEDPPPPGYKNANNARNRGQGRWQQIGRELQKHPGKWALVEIASKKTDGGSRLRAFGCEARQRKNSDGTINLYARWPEDAS